ncbi:MAG TPA: hypothetical protein VKE22_08430 [Haliangiales bacterium]|nr:hypothetical protein [Haliangiales bacterium]
MPLDPAFLEDCLYGTEAVLIDEILAIDRETGLVRARMPTSESLPITRDQRGDPRLHPRHVSGALMVHATGILGFVHAYYVLDLRHADGWVGFGTHIHGARFRALATLGEPLVLEGQATQTRRLAGNLFARYRFRFTQGETVVYESEQSAVWRKAA